MKPVLRYLLLFTGVASFFLPSCREDDTVPAGKKYTFTPAASDADVQGAMIEMHDGDTIYFAQGNYTFTSMLSIDDKSNIVIMGEGRDSTTLSFAGQTSGAQSIYGTNLTWALFRDFTIKDPEGDGIKVKDSDGVTFLRVGVTHTTAADSTNGSYGLYPVTSRNILIDDCYVFGTSDAGIYVGQSELVIVRNSEAEGNVAGIEIENCISADVYGNNAHDNTGGILVFDLPSLPVIKNGHTVRVYNNTIVSNDLKNFAPSGNIVANVPVGTGIMLLSAKKAEVFGNTLTENNVMGIGIVSYKTLETLDGSLVANDPEYDKYSKEINIHDNTITSSTNYPADLNTMADLLVNTVFSGSDVPDILYDGYVHPDFEADSTRGICIKGNGSATFSNVDVPHFFSGLNYDASPHDCSRAALPEVTVAAPAQ
ncbi:MAG TPA: parallel beta-helix domain-containing protein [Chitinophagales bacterium]|nr:parallel beta-helix domain-containing protein [Chitinophagales bacterium]